MRFKNEQWANWQNQALIFYSPLQFAVACVSILLLHLICMITHFDMVVIILTRVIQHDEINFFSVQ